MYNLSQNWIFEGVYGDILDSQIEAKFVDVDAGNYMMEREALSKIGLSKKLLSTIKIPNIYKPK
jgi:hypothetical protein